MLGAIIGDIVGSVYEWHNIKTKKFPLFQDNCHFTDDTVMTIAVAEALINAGENSFPSGDDFIDSMKKWGRKYPDAGYGGRFGEWLFSDSRKPYNSWGNGSAMRVSPVGFRIWIHNTGYPGITDSMLLDANVQGLSTLSAEVTHNHPEGIKGAQAVVDCIIYLRVGYDKAALKEAIESKYEYDLSRTLDEIRPTYKFNESCQETVPQAITAVLESADFEDAIRNAISLGGDSDTLAAITGGIAEAAYGIPQWIKDKAWTYLDEPMKDVCRRWKAFKRDGA
jgi:ADP-ribosylglycohydrolase